MADRELRETERRAAGGDAHAAAKLLKDRQRTGQLVLPPIPHCPFCREDRLRDIIRRGAMRCRPCDGVGELPGDDRIQLAALAGDEPARVALDPKLMRWVNPNDSDMVEIPGVDRYDAQGFVGVTLRKFGVVPAIAAVIGFARHCIEEVEWEPWETQVHVGNALDVFEAWICEPTSSNLVKLEGRDDYGERYQRMFEGCDALASSHARGVEIFWEGFDCLRRGVKSSVIGGSLRRSVRDYARGDHW